MEIQPVRLTLDFVANECYKNDFYTVESELPERMIYTENDGELGIFKTRSYLILKLDDVPAFIEELSGIYEDMQYRRREKMRLVKPEAVRRRKIGGEHGAKQSRAI